MARIPTYQRIGDFLKSNVNRIFTISDLSKNLKVSKKTVSSSLSHLARGRIVKVKGKTQYTKTGKVRRKYYKGFKRGTLRTDGRGRWLAYEKTNYESWRVDFKIRETHTRKRQREWVKIMDLTATAIGVVPSGTNKSKIIEVSAVRLFQKSLEVMADNGVNLYQSVAQDDSSTVVFGARKNTDEVLINRYDTDWNGEIFFRNDQGRDYPPFKVKYRVNEHEYN